jgi:antitoxin component YwqK of YwqJK toxin-antitoxin module
VIAFMEWLKYLVIGQSSTGDGIKVNDMHQGTYYCKYPDGKLMYEENYINDRLNGIQLYWHPNGQINFLINNLNGLRHGICYEYSNDGALISESIYYRDKCIHGWISGIKNKII